MRINSRTALVWLLAMVLAPALAWADRYPSKPIRIVVAFPAGSAGDVRTRQIADRLTKAMAQPVVVENRPGASGAIGAGVVAKAQPDGYTLLYGTVYDLAITPALNPAAGYDPFRDFAPISQVVVSHAVLSARLGLGVKSIKELIRLAKEKPGQLTCGSGGSATTGHFALEMLKRGAGVDIVHVVYKGDPPALMDLLGGNVDLVFSVTTPALPYIRAGKLVPLVVTSTKRLPAFPDVPTAAEVGLADMEVRNWGGFLAPAGTPSEVIDRLNAELAKIVNSAEIRDNWASGGAEAKTGTPGEFAALIATEHARWAKVVKQAGMRME